MKQRADYQDTINKITTITNPKISQQQINEQSMMIQQLIFENNQLKEQVQYLDNKIKQLITSQIEKKKNERKIELSSEGPTINID